MERLKFKVEDESFESQRAAGRHNPGQEVVLTHRKKEYRLPIDAGSRDDVSVFLERGSVPETDLIVVLAINTGLGYAGLDVFKNGEKSGNVFFQSDHQIEEALGKRGLDLRETTIARRLLQYCGD